MRREVKDLKRLLTRAKAYDAANGEPDCELEEKKELVRRIAHYVGVDMSELFQ